MNYVKTKNIVSIYVDDELTKCYRLDVNTGTLIGLRNKPVQSMGSAYRSQFLNEYSSKKNNSFLLHYILNCFRYSYDLRTDLMTFWDKVDSLNDKVVNKCLSQWPCFLREEILRWNFNKLIKYVRENPDCQIKDVIVAFILDEVTNMIGSENQLTADDVKDMAYRLTNSDIKALTPAELRMYNYYIYTQHMGELNYHGKNLVLDYLIHCRKLGIDPRKNNNPTREFYETQKRYEQLKAALSAKAFTKTYANHPKAWEFEYGDFVVRIPSTGADLVTEGAKMHHCVGGYVDDVECGTTYICFIRHKDTPDTPYITCQVHRNGTIGQYYLAYDRIITKEEDKAFKNAYQEYLKEVW